MSNRLLDDLRTLLHRIEKDEEAADRLWTWLPSYAAAQRHYGDYAMEHTPMPAEVMHEAALLLSYMAGYTLYQAQALNWFYCDLDDCDDPPSDAARLDFIKAWFANRGLTLQLDGREHCVDAQKETS